MRMATVWPMAANGLTIIPISMATMLIALPMRELSARNLGHFTLRHIQIADLALFIITAKADTPGNLA
jgi:hypothetical protein